MKDKSPYQEYYNALALLENNNSENFLEKILYILKSVYSGNKLVGEKIEYFLRGPWANKVTGILIR